MGTETSTDYANKNKSYIYKRHFVIPETMTGKNILLNFDAVDWSCVVFVNGQKVGEHQGGYDPFSFDITDALHESGEQELVVQVYDPTEGDQPRGKQSVYPKSIFYTPSSGIWQTVWLEPVADIYIDDFTIIPDIDNSLVKIKVNAVNATANTQVFIQVLDGEQIIATQEGLTGNELSLPIPNPKLWSPDTPFLYNLSFKLMDNDLKMDEVGSYFGMGERQFPERICKDD
jgi:beta-galactosidase/beta-glucuronidase